jgi:hypothetical protein
LHRRTSLEAGGGVNAVRLTAADMGRVRACGLEVRFEFQSNLVWDLLTIRQLLQF